MIATLLLTALFLGDKAPAEDPPESPPDEFLAVVGGDFYTMTAGVLRDGTLLVKNGKIHALGPRVKVPEEATVLDASGLRVYPGLIACNSWGIFAKAPPELHADVFSLTLTLGVASGLTTVVLENTAAKLTYGTLDGLTLRENLFIPLKINAGEERRQLREELEKARDFQRRRRVFQDRQAAGDTEEDEEAPKPEGINEKYLQLVSGQARARFDVQSAHELRLVAALAEEYHLRVTVFGAREGWVVASKLGRAGVTCVINPRQSRVDDGRRNQPNGARIENAARLHAGGVPLAIVPRRPNLSLQGLAGRDLMMMPMEAAFAVRGGLSRDAALEAITIGAARALGIDDRVGSLSVGKDADLIVTDGDLLHFQTLVHFTVVNGKVAYDKSAESLLSHIRPLEGESRLTFPEILEQVEEAAEEAAEEAGGEEGAPDSEPPAEDPDEPEESPEPDEPDETPDPDGF